MCRSVANVLKKDPRTLLTVLTECLCVVVCGGLAVTSSPRSVHGHLHAAPLCGHGPRMPRVGSGADRGAGDQQARPPPAHPRVSPAHPSTAP